MHFNKIITLCERNGFFNRITSSGGSSRKYLKVESTGALLQENLKTEWFNSIVINKDLTVFPSEESARETFQFAKEMCLQTLPFGIAESTDHTVLIEKRNPEPFQYNFSESVILKCFIFVSPLQAQSFFHDWQRQRRMWWRKFSASPGRYSLSDVKNFGDKQSIDISAKYEWGNEVVERLFLTPKPHFLAEDDMKLLDDKKTVQAKCLISETCLSSMLLNTVCDAYDEPEFKGQSRQLLRLHRKLAPYKISFSISSSSSQSVAGELKDLALYLCRQLRNNHVSCLLLPSSYKNTLEAQWKHYDQLGVPYTVQLNENTLKNGIIKLRSRETTLSEQVHITDLSNYVEKLFRNY